MPKTFCVVGHDARQQAAARVLRRAGYGVTAADNAAAADYILLPMSQGRVSDEVARALQGAGQGTLILAGRPGMPVRMAAREAGLPLIDYFLRPELECLNAVPTAEGCLELLLRLRERTIWESSFLVLGYGRVGRAVARRLVLLGGRVTVAARSPEQRANARCAGCRAAPLTALPHCCPALTPSSTRSPRRCCPGLFCSSCRAGRSSLTWPVCPAAPTLPPPRNWVCTPSTPWPCRAAARRRQPER